MRHDRTRILLALAVFAATASRGRAADPGPPAGADAGGIDFFEKRVRPVLVQHCYACHGEGAKQVKGELRLDTRAGVLKGGSTGPAVVPGDPGKSLLIAAVRYEDEALQMPPKAKLPAAEIADLEAWVKMGAPDPRTKPAAVAQVTAVGDHWCFRPVADPPVPDVSNPAWPLNAVDRFVLRRMEAKGLTPVEPCDDRTLIRRVTYDLTGLPPTPDEIDAFLADDSPGAFVRVVDRLLASPAYGERWGRHWLDLVRYSDTAGDNSDYPVPQLYKYRDWVIRSINQDMPYDQFVREQLAGDLMGGATERERCDRIVATGYLANARRFGSETEPDYPWHLTIEDTIDNLGRAFLGLTVSCARCHDHKFDPLGNEDYYALYGIFQSTRYPWPGIELEKAQRDFVPLAPADVVREADKDRVPKLAALDAAVEKLRTELAAAEAALVEAAKTGDDDTRKDRVAAAAKKVEPAKKSFRDAQKGRDKFAQQPLGYDTAYAVSEFPPDGKRTAGNARVHVKGNPDRLGKEVPRRFPAVLGGQSLGPDAAGSGRLELARWVTDPANPLTARVMVNRIWHYHFGKGIVPTPSDFGRQGTPPTHPELLDYLARRFVESGWSLKAMHRLVVLSRTYRLSSRDDAANADIDADNDYLWRYRRHRLDAESIRDTLLSVAGVLDRGGGGPHPFPAQTTWQFTEHKVFRDVYETNRRSVYLMTQRLYRHPFLGLFDGANTNSSTDRRAASTTPLQALYLMNDPFIHAQARHFAGRLTRDRADAAGRVRWAYLLTTGRPATDDEVAAAGDHLARAREALRKNGAKPDEAEAGAWESFARALVMRNEFVYVY